MNKQYLEFGFKLSTSIGGLGLLALGIRQEQRQHREDLDYRFNTIDTKFTNQINTLDNKFTNQISALDTKFTTQIAGLDTKFTNQIAALDTKFTALDKKIDILIVTLGK